MTESTDDGERIRQHVRKMLAQLGALKERVRQHVSKVLAQLRALKERQRAQEKPDPRLGGAGEIDREEHTSGSIGGGEVPS